MVFLVLLTPKEPGGSRKYFEQLSPSITAFFDIVPWLDVARLWASTSITLSTYQPVNFEDFPREFFLTTRQPFFSSLQFSSIVTLKSMTIPLLNTAYDNESDLVQGCKEHNAFAQKLLYNQYAETLMILCLRYITNREDARDVLMKALVECFRDIQAFEYRGEGSLKAWLKKVTVNHCLMHLRKQRDFFREWDDKLEGQLDTVNDQHVVSQLTVKEIMQWIHALPVGYKTVFNLYVFEDMGHKEIAAVLGISENTSKSQLHKARALLQKQIIDAQRIAL